MSQTKHTPGPWEVQGVHIGFYAPNPEAGGEQFCLITKVSDRIGTTEANARLIAAAPDLLAACKAALRIFPESAGCGLTTQLSDAIAKAEGEPKS